MSDPAASQDDGQRSLIQVHIAEYAALTTKATYNIGFCTVIWGLLAGYVTLIVNVWPRIKQSSIIWVNAAVIELLFIWVSMIIFDQYLSLLYIETELKPRLATKLPKGEEYWGWERFVAKRRDNKAALLWEWGMSIGTGLLIISALIWRIYVGWTKWDWQSAISFLLFYFLVEIARDIQNMRKEWMRFNADWHSKAWS